MDLKVVFSAFVAVFAAEMADKTQMVGLGLSSKTGRPGSVFVGSVAAYALITAISVLLGAWLGKALKPEYLRYGGGALFVLMGLLMWAGKI